MFEPLIIPSPEFAETDLAVPEFDPYAAITELKAEIKRLREVLSKIAQHHLAPSRAYSGTGGSDPEFYAEFAEATARKALEPTP